MYRKDKDIFSQLADSLVKVATLFDEKKKSLKITTDALQDSMKTDYDKMMELIKSTEDILKQQNVVPENNFSF